MWMLIMGSMLLAAVIGVTYLISGFARFSFVVKRSDGRKWCQYLYGALLVLVISGLVWFCMGTINLIIVLLHLSVFWMISDAVSYAVRKRRKMNRESERIYGIRGCAVLLFTVLYLAAGWILAHHVWRTEYTVTTEKGIGSLRIVQLADAHVGTTFDGNGFAEHMEEIQKQQPDLVCITGDFVDDDTSKEDMEAACAALGSLKTTYGVYYAFGNHDKGYYGADYRGYSGADLIEELQKNSVIVLQDESILIDERFYLIGRQDRSEEGLNGRASMEELTEGLDPDKYMVVLDHQPHDYEAQEQTGVDLVLSGNTHGGQLLPFNYIGEWTGENEKTYGMEQRGNTSFIVTSGISDWAIKFKTGCRSEYVVIQIVQETPLYAEQGL